MSEEWNTTGRGVNEKQAEILLKANFLGFYPLQVERSTLLSSSQGVINTDSLYDVLDKETQFAIADHFISEAFRLIGKRNNKLFPEYTIIFSCIVLSLAASICIGYERVPVHPCIPDPMWC
jgi:hypothetical protein